MATTIIETRGEALRQHFDGADYVTVAEAADYFRLAEDSLRGLIKRGEIDVVRLGPRVTRIPVDALVAMVDAT